MPSPATSPAETGSAFEATAATAQHSGPGTRSRSRTTATPSTSTTASTATSSTAITSPRSMTASRPRPPTRSTTASAAMSSASRHSARLRHSPAGASRYVGAPRTTPSSATSSVTRRWAGSACSRPPTPASRSQPAQHIRISQTIVSDTQRSGHLPRHGRRLPEPGRQRPPDRAPHHDRHHCRRLGQRRQGRHSRGLPRLTRGRRARPAFRLPGPRGRRQQRSLAPGTDRHPGGRARQRPPDQARRHDLRALAQHSRRAHSRPRLSTPLRQGGSER